MSEFKVFTKTSPDGIVLRVTDGTTITDAIDERRAVEIEHENSEIRALLEENYALSCSKGVRLRYEAVENGSRAKYWSTSWTQARRARRDGKPRRSCRRRSYIPSVAVRAQCSCGVWQARHVGARVLARPPRQRRLRRRRQRPSCQPPLVGASCDRSKSPPRRPGERCCFRPVDPTDPAAAAPAVDAAGSSWP